MADHGLDITKHRKRIIAENLDVKVGTQQTRSGLCSCAMWTTGFDVPSVLRFYLDKPDEEPHAHADHRACQPGIPEKAKRVDRRLCRVAFRDLEKALTIYASPVTGDEWPTVKDKPNCRTPAYQIASTTRFCAQHGVDIDALLPLSGFPMSAGMRLPENSSPATT